MQESSPSKDRRSPSSSPDPLALISSPPRSRSRDQSCNGTTSGRPARACRRGLSRTSRTSDRSGTRSPQGRDTGSYVIRLSSSVKDTNELDDVDNMSAGLPKNSKRKESFELSTPTALIRSSSDGSLSPSKGYDSPQPLTQMLRQTDFQGFRNDRKTTSTALPSRRISDFRGVVSSVPHLENPLHMLAFAVQETLEGEAAQLGESTELGDGDLDAEGEKDIKDSYDVSQHLGQPTPEAAQASTVAPSSDLLDRIAGLPPAVTSELKSASMLGDMQTEPTGRHPPRGTCDPDFTARQNEIRLDRGLTLTEDDPPIGGSTLNPMRPPAVEKLEQHHEMDTNGPALAAAQPPSSDDMAMRAQSRLTGDLASAPGLDSDQQDAIAAPVMESSILTGEDSTPRQSQLTNPEMDVVYFTQHKEIPPIGNTESPNQDRDSPAVTHDSDRCADASTTGPTGDLMMIDLDVHNVSSSNGLYPVSEPPAGLDDPPSRTEVLASAVPPPEASNVTVKGDIDLPEKLQSMGAMGDRSLHRHLREMEKAAIAWKRSEEAAGSSTTLIPTTEVNKRRKLAPKPSNVTIHAKSVKEELEVDGDIWKALALDEAREKDSETTATNPRKNKPKGKTGKGKKQQQEQAEPGQKLLASSVDHMDVDSGPSLTQEEPRDKKRANKRGARFVSPAASVSTNTSNKKSKDQPVVDVQHNLDEAEDGVWCICKEPYDENRVMILCDGLCNNWYHIECVGLDPLLVPLVNIFICPDCDKDPFVVWTTTYQEKCLRELCRQPRRQPLSKYCSQACGFHHMSSMMQAQHSQVSDIAPFVLQAEEPEAYILDHSHATMSTRIDCAGSAKRRRRSQVDNVELVLVARQASLCQKLDAIKHQQAQLEIAAQKAEDLADIQPAIEDPAELTKKRGKKMPKAKQRHTAEDSRPCGFDTKLLSLNPQMQGDHDPTMTDELRNYHDVCLEAKRKCARHNGWQKLRAVALELEHNTLNEEIQNLGSRLQGFR